MCVYFGIFGNWKNIANPDVVLRQMADPIAHRGPDSGLHWFDEAGTIEKDCRRLAIVDFSSAAMQPMVSVSGRWVLIFNGEIPNHLDLSGQRSWQRQLWCVLMLQAWLAEQTPCRAA